MILKKKILLRISRTDIDIWLCYQELISKIDFFFISSKKVSYILLFFFKKDTLSNAKN